jgi:hypothetical protein
MSRHRVMNGHVIFKFSGNIEHNNLLFTQLGFLCSLKSGNIFNIPLYSLINFRLIIPSNIHLQCLCRTKNQKKQHNEGNMALRIIPLLTH